MIINVKKVHPDAIIPQYMTIGAAGFDLCAVEDVTICPGEVSVKVRLGLSFEIPEGYVMYICMRSGIALKTTLRQSNGIGVIDSDYRGEVNMLFDNTAYLGMRNVHIKKGDRICQGIISPIHQAVFTETEELSTTNRGSGGFGHTGV